jgi:anti-sigma factor RsiW
MQCDDVTVRLGAYLDGELSGQAAEEVRSHLEGCPACVRRQEQAFARRTAPGVAATPSSPGSTASSTSPRRFTTSPARDSL